MRMGVYLCACVCVRVCTCACVCLFLTITHSAKNAVFYKYFLPNRIPSPNPDDVSDVICQKTGSDKNSDIPRPITFIHATWPVTVKPISDVESICLCQSNNTCLVCHNLCVLVLLWQLDRTNVLVECKIVIFLQFTTPYDNLWQFTTPDYTFRHITTTYVTLRHFTPIYDWLRIRVANIRKNPIR